MSAADVSFLGRVGQCVMEGAAVGLAGALIVLMAMIFTPAIGRAVRELAERDDGGI